MYVIIRNKEQKAGIDSQYTEENKEYRQKFYETKEELGHLDPKGLAVLRRFAIKKSRFQDKSPKSIAEAAAIRDLMEHKIND